jgi:hypothetical protein
MIPRSKKNIKGRSKKYQGSKVIKGTNAQSKKYKISKKQTPVKKDIKNIKETNPK